MASFIKQFTFTPGTTALSSQLNTNLDDIANFLNNGVIHADGSKAFTAVPTGPATDPSSDNHLARKRYVDDGSRKRPVFPNTTGTSSILGTYNGQQTTIKAGFNTGLTGPEGNFIIDFGGAFPNGIVSLVLTCVAQPGYNYLRSQAGIYLIDLGKATIRISDSNTGASLLGTNIGVTWMAIGW